MEANASGAISASWTTIRDWAISHSAPPKWERGTISSIGRAIRYKGDPSGYLFAARLPKITTTRTAKPITQLLAPRRGAVRTIGQDLFCGPHRSCQHGTNENTNGLIRQHFPKGTDFRKVSDSALKRAVAKLHNRHRKRLGYRTSAQVFLGEHSGALKTTGTAFNV